MKVVMLDTDWHFAARAQSYFESRGDLVSTERPESLVSRVRAWQPDLVILSAEYASEELLDALLSIPQRPAVLLTETLSRFDRAWAAWQNGGDELLIKPIFRDSELHHAAVVAMENAAVHSRWAPRQKAIPA